MAATLTQERFTGPDSRAFRSKPLARVAEVKDARPWERACAEGWEGVG